MQYFASDFTTGGELVSFHPSIPKDKQPMLGKRKRTILYKSRKFKKSPASRRLRTSLKRYWKHWPRIATCTLHLMMTQLMLKVSMISAVKLCAVWWKSTTLHSSKLPERYPCLRTQSLGHVEPGSAMLAKVAHHVDALLTTFYADIIP